MDIALTHDQSKLYHISPGQTEISRKDVWILLDLSVIEVLSSDYASPMILVKMKIHKQT